MNTGSPFRMLLSMFQNRFFEDDTVSPGGGFETNIYQVLGFLLTVGFFVAYLTLPAFVEFTFGQARGPAAGWTLRSFRLFGPALSFAVIGFATFFQWDMLFPDRRDFLILSLLPVPLRQIFMAKCAALWLYLGMLTGALNLFPTLATTLFSLAKASTWGIGLRLIAAQMTVILGASVFAFLLVAAFQGVLINLTSPRIFRRISPWIQMFGMSLMVLSISTYPVYFLLLRPAVEARKVWLWLFPPIWFASLYDLLLPGGDAFFVSLGKYAITALTVVFLCFCLTWLAGFRRHFRRTLEAEDTLQRRPSRLWLRRVAGSPQEWAILSFCGKTLARSVKHRLFLATWASAGLSAGMFVALAVRNGKLEWSPDGSRAFPFLLAFFAISGLRTVFQFPSALTANWLLQMTESRWSEIARRAARKAVLIYGIIPVLALVLPFEIYATGSRGVFHIFFQLTAGALLIEIMFWQFGKVPFTCSYFAGRTSLAILAAFYLYGFTVYSFNLADLEKLLDERVFWTPVFFAAGLAALALLWRRTPAPSEVTFDAGEPLIQTLDLN